MRKALVIGIDDYPGAELQGGVQDATTIAQLLRNHGNGDPNFDVKLLTSPPTAIGRVLLRARVEELFADPAEVALFYFAGNAMVNGAGGYLMTLDSRSHDEGLAMATLMTLAKKSPAENKVIMLDCCHAGAVAERDALGGDIAELARGMTILTASLQSQAAVEADGAGVFSSLIADALRGGAADLRGDITPGSLYAYVDEALGGWEQRPMFKANVSRLCRLRRVPPRVPLNKLRRVTRYFTGPAAAHALDPSYEFTEASADPVKVAIFKDLQQFVGIGLVVPVGEEHMYWAALRSKSCRLTAMGRQYWRLVSEGRLGGEELADPE